MTTHVQQTLPFPWRGGYQCSLQLLIQSWICAPGTHYGWVDRGSVEYEVCPTPLHMASNGNRTPDLLILSPTPYPLGHMLPHGMSIQYPEKDASRVMSINPQNHPGSKAVANGGTNIKTSYAHSHIPVTYM